MLTSRVASATIRNLLTSGFEPLELLNIGLVVTSASGHLLLANQAAEKVLRLADGLELSPWGTLRTHLSDSALLVKIKQVTTNPMPGNPQPRVSVLAVPRTSGKRPLSLVIRAARNSFGCSDRVDPVVLIFILDPELPLETAETELRQLYGLTSAETRMAALLMEGNSLDDCCYRLGIRRSTARMHLRHLFGKTGVQRQGELVSLLFKSIGPVRAGKYQGRPSVRNSHWEANQNLN